MDTASNVDAEKGNETHGHDPGQPRRYLASCAIQDGVVPALLIRVCSPDAPLPGWVPYAMVVDSFLVVRMAIHILLGCGDCTESPSSLLSVFRS